MDRKWLSFPRFSSQYQEGVRRFITIAQASASDPQRITCPCVTCRNSFHGDPDMLFEHLVIKGMDPMYTTWFLHGEKLCKSPVREIDDKSTVFEGMNDSEEPINNKARAIRASQDLVYRSSRMGLGRLGHKRKQEAADPRTVNRPNVRTKGYLGNQTKEQQQIREYKLTPKGQHSSGIHDDAIAHIFSPECSGRVRGMGVGVTPSKVNAICGASRANERIEAKWDYMKETMMAMQAALEAHGISIDKFRSTSMRRENTALASSSMPDEDPDHRLHNSVHGKVQLMHYLKHDIAVGVGEIASVDPNENVHNVPLGERNCKVWVEAVLIPCVHLFRPTTEATTIDEAVGSTVAWPIAAIRPLPD